MHHLVPWWLASRMTVRFGVMYLRLILLRPNPRGHSCIRCIQLMETS